MIEVDLQVMESGGEGVPEVMVEIKVRDGEADGECVLDGHEERVCMAEILIVIGSVFERDGIGVSSDWFEGGEGIGDGVVIRDFVMDDRDGIRRQVFVVRGRDGSPVGVGIGVDGKS